MNEGKIISRAKLLMCYEGNVIGTEEYMVALFSMSLTMLGIERSPEYNESDSNHIVKFIIDAIEDKLP